MVWVFLSAALAMAEPPKAVVEFLKSDPKAVELATEIWQTAGWTVTVEEPYRMNGGWRGVISIVPQPPTGRYRAHLDRVLAALQDYQTFFAALDAAKTDATPSFRWRDIEIKYFRSVKRATPSAYASSWSIAYNVNGSLLKKPAGVRRTLFHEIFHLNDEQHGDWTRKLLPIYQGIIKRCTVEGKLDDACLKPHAPGRTKVKGSTYYAFHPGEGVEEYGAELALRYYTEHRRVLLAKKKVRAPFKCASPDNDRAWRMMVTEFFGGVDVVGICSDKPK